MKLQKLVFVALTGGLLSIGTLALADSSSSAGSTNKSSTSKSTGSHPLGKGATQPPPGANSGPSSSSTATVPYVRPPS